MDFLMDCSRTAIGAGKAGKNAGKRPILPSGQTRMALSGSHLQMGIEFQPCGMPKHFPGSLGSGHWASRTSQPMTASPSQT
jgi:hypothetical protein